jgi:hypothetical protein
VSEQNAMAIGFAVLFQLASSLSTKPIAIAFCSDTLRTCGLTFSSRGSLFLVGLLGCIFLRVDAQLQLDIGSAPHCDRLAFLWLQQL